MITISASITNNCQLRCGNPDYGCIAQCQRHNTDRSTMIDFDAMLKWMGTHFGKCNLHVTGGEPLLHPGLYSGLLKCINAGHDVTLFSNGIALPSQPELYELPIKWHVTKHRGISDSDFAVAIEPLRNKPHVICRIFGRGKEPDRTIEALYHGFNFRWIEANTNYENYTCSFKNENPNERILFIDKDGSVHNCSEPAFGKIGSTIDGTFDREKYEAFRCPSKKWPHACQAASSAEIMEGLK